MILVGDIGGTNTRLALFQEGKNIQEGKYPSKEYKSLEEIIRLFLSKKRPSIEKACFGIAGPVLNGICKATNLPWLVDAKKLSKTFSISEVRLLNDLEAKAYGISTLPPKEVLLIQKGKERQSGNQAFIAAGTGLGQAGLFWDGKEHTPFATEGGHVDFAPKNEEEIDLFCYLKEKLEHVSYERIVSGPGLVTIYQFLIETGREFSLKEVEEAMQHKDPASVITEWGASNKDPASTRAVDWFISFYGAEAGNMALKYLSLGGIYIGGGVAPHLKKKMNSKLFREAFNAKGRFKPLLETIPIRLILDDDQVSLAGAARYLERR